MELPSGTRFGRYEIVALVGSGGMGHVYRARDPRLARDVAIKVLPLEYSADPDRLHRFETEARLAGGLNHPNILTIFDVGAEGGHPYLVSELLEGESLRGRLKSGPIPLRKAADISKQLASGLVAAHGRGITHRDLKPENIFLLPDGRVKILDFGLAKLIHGPAVPLRDDQPTLTDHATRPGAILGTVGYIAPEQVRGESIDHRADLFSFGVILFEMLLGRRPFPGATAVDVLHAILHDDPMEEDPPGLHPGVARIIRHCLDKTPTSRFQSAGDLSFSLGELDSFEKPEPSAAPRRALRPVLAVTILVLVTAAFLALALRPDPTARATGPAFRRLTFRRGLITEARFFPDGRSVAYAAAFDGDPIEVFTMRLEAPEYRRLGFRGAGLLSVSLAGELALSLECEFFFAQCLGTLARAPISGGSPRQILENVDRADWAPNGQELAIVRAFDGAYRIEFPAGKVIYQTQDGITDMRISPEGDLIAFFETDLGWATRRGSLCVVDLKGNKRVLSSGWQEVRGLDWNGPRQIWFTAAKVYAKSLYSIDVPGSDRQPDPPLLIHHTIDDLILNDIGPGGKVLLTQGGARMQIRALVQPAQQERNLAWFDHSWLADLSPDGRTLLFTEAGEATGSTPTTYLRKMSEGEPVRLGTGRALALSPDGRWALTLQRDPVQQLTLLPTGPGDGKLLPRGDLVDFYFAAFFPDGRRIVFAAENADRSPRSYIQDLAGGQPEPFSDAGLLAVLVSPDGALVAVLNPIDGLHYLVPVAGGRPTPMRGVEPGDILLQWTSDSQFVYLRRPGSLTLEIDRVHLASGRRESWKRLTPADGTAIVNINLDGVRITPDGRSYAYTITTNAKHLYLADFAGGLGGLSRP